MPRLASRGKQGKGRTAYRDEEHRHNNRDRTTKAAGTARYRVTGRDEDDDKLSTLHRQERKSRRTQDTGLARQAGARAPREPSAGCRWATERKE